MTAGDAVDGSGLLDDEARPPGASALSATLTFAWRSMQKIRHVPEQLIDATVTPVMFLLLFTYLFGGAVAGSTRAYLQYLLPAILAMSVLFMTVYSGVTLNTDMTKGVVDRFRTLPVWRPAPLLGGLIGDTARYGVAAVIVIALGFALGYRAHGGVAGVAAAVALVVVFCFGLSWLFTVLGLLLRSANAVLYAGWFVIFPLTFLTNAFVDPATLPPFLRWVVHHNPVTDLIGACRSLMDGTPVGSHAAVALATAAGLAAVFAPLTSVLYGKKR
ncbi:MAG TPA: ABC transporter permease [Acidimicrobiia bacterium]|nr:ABC transporter permease [Acidimicrobiia bacterium]